MRAALAAALLAAAGCAGEDQLIRSYPMQHQELSLGDPFGQAEEMQATGVRNSGDRTTRFWLRCTGATDYPAEYRFPVRVRPRSETWFQAEYPVRYAHVRMCREDPERPREAVADGEPPLPGEVLP